MRFFMFNIYYKLVSLCIKLMSELTHEPDLINGENQIFFDILTLTSYTFTFLMTCNRNVYVVVILQQL
jgi:hypothetical protein